MATLRKNEVGVPLRVETTLDLSQATATSLRVRKPRNALVVWTDGTVDGSAITYITKAGDLDVVGEYTIVAHVEFDGGGQSRDGPPATINVKEVFDE
jgi:hypothetical protein